MDKKDKKWLLGHNHSLTGRGERDRGQAKNITIESVPAQGDRILPYVYLELVSCAATQINSGFSAEGFVLYRCTAETEISKDLVN